jgi:hypothetical protein
LFVGVKVTRITRWAGIRMEKNVNEKAARTIDDKEA